MTEPVLPAGSGWKVQAMREVYPPRLRSVRCNGCKKSVTMILIYDENGKKKYECIGDPKLREVGCGKRVDPKWEGSGDVAEIQS